MQGSMHEYNRSSGHESFSTSRWRALLVSLSSRVRRRGRQCGAGGFTPAGCAAAMFLLLSAPVPALEGEAWRASAERVVRIVSISDTGRQFGGSGVIIGQDEVATNCHVTRIAAQVVVYTRTGVLRASAQRADPAHDLCVLSVPGARWAGDVAATTNHAPGARVWALGYSNSRGLLAQEGRVVAVFPMDGAGVIQGDAEFTHGMSGGGLFDERGNLAGLLTFFRTSDNAPPSYFAVPAGWIARVRELPARDVAPLTHAPFWARPLAEQPLFLQAGALEAAGHWQDMLRVSRIWVETDAADPNAWIMLGRAAQRAGDMDGMHLALSGLGKLALGMVGAIRDDERK